MSKKKKIKKIKQVPKRVKKSKLEKRTKPAIKKRTIAKRKRKNALKVARLVKVPVHETKIRIIGIGGGGSSIVTEIASEIKKASFVTVNTDRQALKEISGRIKRFQLGQELIHGLGTGMDPKLGEQAALNDKEKIRKLLEECDLCILIACLGGGTGSGASPVFAEVSSKLKQITVGIFTLPFEFEGRKKKEIAKETLEKLKPYLNSAVIIPNEKILQILDKKIPLKKAFSTINMEIARSIDGLIGAIHFSGLINIDFADFKTVLAGKGKLAYLSAIEVKPKQIGEATKELLSKPLFDYSAQGASNVLFNIDGGINLSMSEIEEIGKAISSSIRPRVRVIFGVNRGQSKGVRITLLANGCKWEKWDREQEQTKKKSKKEGIKEQELISEVKEEPEKLGSEAKERKPKRKPRKKRRPKIKVRPKVINETEKKETVLPVEETPQSANEGEASEEKKWDIPAFLRRK